MQSFLAKNNLQICQLPFLVRNHGRSNIESMITLWCGKPFSRDLALWQEEARFIEENAAEVLKKCEEFASKHFDEMLSSFEKFQSNPQDSQFYRDVYATSMYELKFWRILVNKIMIARYSDPAIKALVKLGKIVGDYIQGEYDVQ